MNIKAIILAAGYATRLYPLTKEKPKALLEIKGKTILDYLVEKLESVKEVDEILLVTNNKFSLAFEQWADERKPKKPLRIINDATMTENDRLGAVGDMNFVVEMEKIFDSFLVVAADNLFEYDLQKLVDFFREKNSSVVACIDMKDKERIKHKFGVVEFDKQKKVVGFEEKPANPKTTFVATACYIFRKEDVSLLKEYLKEGHSKENAGDFLKYVSVKSGVHALVFKDKWFDIGTFEELGRAREAFNG